METDPTCPIGEPCVSYHVYSNPLDTEGTQHSPSVSCLGNKRRHIDTNDQRGIILAYVSRLRLRDDYRPQCESRFGWLRDDVIEHPQRTANCYVHGCITRDSHAGRGTLPWVAPWNSEQIPGVTLKHRRGTKVLYNSGQRAPWRHGTPYVPTIRHYISLIRS